MPSITWPGSHMHKNLEMGEFASRKLVKLEAKNHGAYALLSNIYADSRNWDHLIKINLQVQSQLMC